MARITPLWSSEAFRVYRFDHPPEHEDKAFEAVSPAYRSTFVETGDFHLAVGDQTWRVGAGDIMLSHPGMGFRSSFEGEGFNDTCLTVAYETAEADGFDPGPGWSRNVIRRSSGRQRFLAWRLRGALDAGLSMQTEAVTAAFFEAGSAVSAPSMLRDRTFNRAAERVMQARERLEHDFATDLSVSQLARSVGMSRHHFTHLFTELMGTPPHRYHLQVRLEAAHRMLDEGRSVTETCYACGFNNLSHFSRSFTRRYGVAPHIRKKVQARP